LHIDSLVPLLRSILKEAGVVSPELYSGHSLRRGFATWASKNGWDVVKTLMQYVGWKGVHSAMRYVDSADPFARHRIGEILALDSSAK
jgi:integrase